MGSTGAAKKGALREEQEGPGDTWLGPLYQCSNVLRDHQNHYCESGTEREKRVGVTKLRVEMVSLAEWDMGHRRSDLPNRVGQVIELVKKMKSTRRKCGVEMMVERPMERSGSRVGQLVRLKVGNEQERGCDMRTRDAG